MTANVSQTQSAQVGDPVLPMAIELQAPAVLLYSEIRQRYGELFGLMCTQFFLITKAQLKLHRYLGWSSAIIAIGFTVTSIVLFLSTLERALMQGQVYQLVYWVDLFLVPLFAFLLIAGFINRKSPKQHGLCILLSLIAIFPPGLGRFLYGVFLYPFNAPIRYIYEPMMLITVGLIYYFGKQVSWQSKHAKITFVVVLVSFLSSYWATDMKLLETGFNWLFSNTN